MVLENLSGGDLFDKLIDGDSLSENKARIYITQVLNALNYIHLSGIVHKNIRPDNIIFDSKSPDAILRISDFGFPWKIEEMLKTYKSVIITQLYYMAPEMIKRKYNNPKSDIWSTGAILYMMAIGRPPFTGKSAKIIKKSIYSGAKFIDSDWMFISVELRDLISRMLIQDPNLRVTAIEALNHPWIQNKPSNDILLAPQTLKALSIFQVKSNQTRNKFEKAILKLINTELIVETQNKELIMMFKVLDSNHDGKISLQELTEGFDKLNLEDGLTADQILRCCDTDSSGYIEFSEFITATTN